MLETIATSFVGWMLLASASYKVRRDLDITAPATIAGLRLLAGVLLVTTLVRCGAPVTGERWVRFLGGIGISGVLAVALLSVAPLRGLGRTPK